MTAATTPHTPPAPPAIELRGMAVGYGSHRLLEGVSATIAAGSRCAVMGPNGCGKTTLLRCIGGLMSPLAGTAAVMGQPVGAYTARQLAQRVAYVQQRPEAEADFVAHQLVLMGRNPYRRGLRPEGADDLRLVEEAMRQTGTWHLRHARLDSVSGGELQRIMLARALAQQTPVMLLDEPVANLDIAHQLAIMDLLTQIDDKTVLIVVHDLNLALRYCPTLLLLGGGGVVYSGPTAQGLTAANIRRVFGVEASVADGWLRIHGPARRAQ